MRYRIYAFVGQNGVSVYQPQNGNAVFNGYAEVDEAKRAMEDYISRNKNTFQNGYLIYVIDTKDHAIVATATIPVPTLEWKDLTATK